MMKTQSTPRATILVIDDDREFSATLCDVLENSGYRTWHAENGADAKAMLAEALPDLIILDLVLPDIDGLVLCATIKSNVDVPIVICSGTVRKRDGILALKLGADDFIAKPFDVDDLEARVDVILRRSNPARGAENTQASGEQYRVGDLVMEPARRRVTLGREALQLTPTEYRLLASLMSRPGNVLSREELAQHVWGYSDASNGRTIDVHIRRLRVKLNAGPVAAPGIVSVRGFGYKIVAESEADISAA